MRSTALIPLAAAFLSTVACQNPTVVDQAPNVIDEAVVGATQPNIQEYWQLLREQLSTSDPELLSHLDNAFSTELESYFVRNSEASLEDLSGELPTLPLFTVPLRYQSLYDGISHTFWMRTPSEPTKAAGVILALGRIEDDLRNLQGYGDYWIIQATSRHNLNYQLVEEGELWQTLSTAERVYPQIVGQPLLLVAPPQSADAALLLADAYPWRFKGLAFSGGKLGLSLPNLQELPIAYFPLTNSELPPSPWCREQLIQRLNQRGNDHATVCESLSAALTFLCSSKDANATHRYQFRDYHTARAAPWLVVKAKRCEEEPVRLTMRSEGRVLVIEAPNVSSVSVTRSSEFFFPPDIRSIRFNGDLYALPKSASTVVLGEEVHGSHNKSDTPSAFIDYFRNEMVVVTYQDAGAGHSYCERARALAEAISRLQFRGLRAKEINLPLVPLSQYQPSAFPHHRLIAVGREEALRPIMEKTPGYYPVQRETDNVNVGYLPLSLPADSRTNLAYGISYPPEGLEKVSLAFLLVSDDEEGLDTVRQHYLSATTLYDLSDFTLWSKGTEGYCFAHNYTFDAYFGCSSIPSTELSIPPLSRDVWEQYLQDLLITAGQTSELRLPELTDRTIECPTKITPASLARFIPERHFALVRCSRATTSKVLEKLQVADKELPLLCDVLLLDRLSLVERETLHYQILPYSLHELLDQRLELGATAFGRDLLRLNNELYF